MRSTKWLLAGLLMLTLAGNVAYCQPGHGKGHNKHDRDDDDDRGKGHYRYDDHDRDEMRGWYRHHDNDLPPGLAKRDRLPPGLERQLVVRGTLPPGLRKKMHPCPVEVERQLPPPPPGYMHTVIGGHIVLVHRRTFFVLDMFHLEL